MTNNLICLACCKEFQKNGRSLYKQALSHWFTTQHEKYNFKEQEIIINGRITT